MSRLRLGFAIAGFLLAFLSVALNDERVAWAAIAVLAGSIVIRLLLRRRESENSEKDQV